MMTDPIADMLTRIRNAFIVNKEKVSMPSSKMKLEIARILKEEGYVDSFRFDDDEKQGILTITFKYTADSEPAITGLRRVSKPGRRVYCSKEEIPRVLDGLGIAILSTSKGIMTDSDARKKKIGGELLCEVW
jgi:small subunit ribosomal protein S8